MSPKPAVADRRPVASNRKARHDFEVLDTYECGIVLTGSEVKVLRSGKAQLREAFARVEGNEVWLYSCHIPPYPQAVGYGGHDPDRRRKLLLHRKQIEVLGMKTSRDGLTLVPLTIYFNDGRAKVELAVARGRKTYDKRHAIAARDVERETARNFARGRRVDRSDS